MANRNLFALHYTDIVSVSVNVTIGNAQKWNNSNKQWWCLCRKLKTIQPNINIYWLFIRQLNDRKGQREWERWHAVDGQYVIKYIRCLKLFIVVIWNFLCYSSQNEKHRHVHNSPVRDQINVLILKSKILKFTDFASEWNRLSEDLKQWEEEAGFRTEPADVLLPPFLHVFNPLPPCHFSLLHMTELMDIYGLISLHEQIGWVFINIWWEFHVSSTFINMLY